MEWTRWHAFHRAINQGYEYFKYSGPQDAAALPLCHHLVGKIWSADELARFQPDGHDAGSVFVFGGGSGCRHHLQPVRREWFDANDWKEQRGGVDESGQEASDRKAGADVFVPSHTGPSRDELLAEGVCPGCHARIDVETSPVCTHCGERINEYLEVPRANVLEGAGRWLLVAVVMVGFFGGMALLIETLDWLDGPEAEEQAIDRETVNPTSATDRKKSEVPYTGEVGYLWQEGASSVIVAGSEEALDAFVDASVKNDAHGTQDLLSAGLVGVAWGNTKIRVLETGWTVVKVRVLEGKFEGQAVWTVTEAVHRQKNGSLPKGLGLAE